MLQSFIYHTLKTMRKLFFILGFSCSGILNAQDFQAANYVAPVKIENLVAQPQKPAGFYLANVDFLTNNAQHASSALVLDEEAEPLWRYTNPLNLSSRAGSIFNFNRINDTTMVFYTFENGPGYYLVLNNDFSIRDSVRSIGAVNRMRPHDLLLLPNGNYLTMANRIEAIKPTLHGTVVKPGIVLDSSSSTIENI